ncbi:NAD(P)-binding protein [Penicillium alfredii]|uniref:NAD(P)-binding protein n=1 Tax=Penicillium alfredii TaxID=1506179 RepID=A0A9W9GAP9_9EURO|nr:NAD(P)-binding protein [Penicillium alfredii]KAJ5115008.1 NAD(P)-binding protein [Penicillium alfredii]
MASPFKTVALFGANGQVGNRVFKALIRCKGPEFSVIAFVSPNSSFNLMDYGDINATVKRVDLNHVARDDLVAILADAKVDVVISALGGQIIAKQCVIQDAAAKAGVKRFYPSEFGMHQVAWLPDEGAYLDPVSDVDLDLKAISSSLSNNTKIWALKIKCFEDAIRHPAIKSGQMSYTVIGCGEFYDAPGEPLLCPWLEKDESISKGGYSIQCVGDPDAKMDYSSLTDIANFVVATLRHPERSENRILGFRSDHITYNEIARLLQKYSGKPAKINITSVDQMRAILKDPSSAPKELLRGSTFPVDFWMILRHVQGQGVFWRPPGLLHNDLFPEVKPVSVEEYFRNLFAK